MIRQAWAAVGVSLADLWENILVLVTANLIWAVSLLPGVFLGGVLGGGLFVFMLAFVVVAVLGGPTTIALFYLTADTTRRERIELGDFWRGIRRYYRRGWLLGGINCSFLLLAVFNLIFYSQPDFADSPIRLMYIVWIYLLLAWFLLQLYLWPLAIRMEPESRLSVVLLLRNTALATFKYIGFSLVLGGISLLLFVLEIVIVLVPLILFGMVLYSLISNRAANTVLGRENERATLANHGATAVSSTAIVGAPTDIVEADDLLADQKSPVAKSDYTSSTPPGVRKRGL